MSSRRDCLERQAVVDSVKAPLKTNAAQEACFNKPDDDRETAVNVKATPSPDDLARACAEAMWREDDASRGLGMELIEVKPGQATLTMTIKPHMVNGQRIAHGGFIFTLADSAFAFACN